MTALMSCAVTRMVCAERRTLPSRTAPTFSLRAIVPMSVFVPLNENAEVRAATCSSLIAASELSSSSVSPSEKYSCSLSPLRFTNGSTAIECGDGAKAAGVGVRCFEIQNLSARSTPAPRRGQRSRAVPALTARWRGLAP